MQNTRRKFVLTAGLVAGSAALGGIQALAGGSPSSDVDTVISRYGTAVKVKKSDTTAEYRVKMTSHQKFAKVFDPENLPFERILVTDGNTMKFTHGGVDVTIVNVA